MRRKLSLWFLFIILFSISSGSLSAQVVSQKNELAVFKLSYYRWDIPNAVLGGIDEEIRSVFINLGRFEVVGLTQRLEPGDLNEFIDKIKSYKEERVEIPQEVQMGREFFTRADFDRLVGSFIVVVPTVANYVVARQKSGEYQVNIKSSFTFINVEEGRTFAQAFVDTEGKDENADLAVKEALDAIPMKLTFEIRKIPEFRIKTGIIEVRGSEVFLELGMDMGLQVGDEYVIVAGEILQSGRAFTRETGLIVIKEVSAETSKGKIIYAQPRPQVGDQLDELARFGMDSTPYVHLAQAVFFGRESTALIGARQAVSRGFFGFRPIVGIEVPLIPNIALALPLNVYVGGEYDLYFGRFQLVPMAGLGVGMAYLWYLKYVGVEEDERFLLTHVGGIAGITANYLFHKNFRFSIEAGYLGWFSLISKVLKGDLTFPDYDGLYVGAGLTIKY